MKQQRISGKEAVRVAEDMAKPGPIRVVEAATEAQEAPGALVPSPGSELDRKAPPRWSSGNGSWSKTSMAAPAIFWALSAAIRAAASTTIGPRPFWRCRSLRLVLPAYDFFDRAIAT